MNRLSSLLPAHVILDEILNGIAVIDMNGIIVQENRRLKEMAGGRSLVGKYLMRCISREDHRQILEELRRFAKTGRPPVYLEFTGITSDGKKLRCSSRNSVVKDERGEPVFVICAVSEISQSAAELVKLAEAKESAEAADRAKSMFLSNISHELRSPLNAILGFSRILREQLAGPLNESQNEYLDDIMMSSDHLLSLINDIHDLSRLETGRIEPVYFDFHVRSVLEHSIDLMGERTAAHRVSISLCMAAELKDLVITSDERILRQIMSNLLSNALNFTPDGGAIAVKAGSEGESLVVQVTDSGIGLSADDLGRVFDEFYQAGGRVGRSKSWTGLGLSLVKKLVGLLGGSIQAECGRQGKGSIFTFTLPLAAGRISSSSPAL